MDTWWLFLVFLRASILSVSSTSALPLVRQDLLAAGMTTDQQIIEALTIGRLGTGPGGLYLVAIGFFAMGLVGAIAAAVATVLPPLLVIPLAAAMRPRLASPRINGLIRGMAMAASGLVVVTSLDILLTEAGGVPSPWQLAILGLAFAAGLHGRVHPAVIIAGGALCAIVVLGI
jgi:chromate transport protein ChrA